MSYIYIVLIHWYNAGKNVTKPEKNRIEFTLDATSGVPFYKQIIRQIELARADGRLANGDQLPTVRSLAVDLQVNPNTVARAYSELEIRGIVTTQQGTGTFMSDREITMTEVERERILTEMVQQFLTNARSYGFSTEEILESIAGFDHQ